MIATKTKTTHNRFIKQTIINFKSFFKLPKIIITICCYLLLYKMMPYFNNPVTINTPNPFPIIDDVTVASSSSCGVNDGTITISASGGTGNFEYSIDGGSTWQVNNAFTGQAAGMYNVYVKNSTSPDCVRPYTQNPVIVAAPTTQDSLSLVEIYENNGGTSWTYSAMTYDGFGTTYNIPNQGNTWNLSTPFNTWHGVKVDGNGCVEKIVLNDNGLTGNVQNLAFTPEETLYYLYSDCEDRSALFYNMVKEILKIDVVLVDFPGHASAAVHFEKSPDKDRNIKPVFHKGKAYYVCDPTGPGNHLRLGEYPSGFENTTPRVLTK